MLTWTLSLPKLMFKEKFEKVLNGKASIGEGVPELLHNAVLVTPLLGESISQHHVCREPFDLLQLLPFQHLSELGNVNLHSASTDVLLG